MTKSLSTPEQIHLVLSRLMGSPTPTSLFQVFKAEQFRLCILDITLSRSDTSPSRWVITIPSAMTSNTQELSVYMDSVLERFRTMYPDGQVKWRICGDTEWS